MSTDPHTQIVRIDSEFDALLALGPSEAARRLMELYRIAEPQEPFVAALVGRLILVELLEGKCPTT
ncbi:hypothetical protein KBK24_0121605 [Burkholderia sp. K24]|nr:hypothetical protein KBK24_0121605 [Burkholderia sp. K24]